jgi:hypothetical protein
VRREQAIIMAVCQHYSVRVYETNNVEEITHSDHSEKKNGSISPLFRYATPSAALLSLSLSSS